MIEVWKSVLKVDDREFPELPLPFYPHLMFFLEQGEVNGRSTTEKGIIGYFLYDLIVNLKIRMPLGLTRETFRATIVLEGDDGEDEVAHYDYPQNHPTYLRTCFETIWQLKMQPPSVMNPT